MTQRPRRSSLFPYTTLFRSTNVGVTGDIDVRSTAIARWIGGQHQGLLQAARIARGRGFNADRGTKGIDRKSTRLNSSHANISYAVFRLKKKRECQLETVTGR